MEKKYKYTFLVKKVVVMDCEEVEVVASSQHEAEMLALAEAKKISEWEVDKTNYSATYQSMSAKPVVA